MKNDGKPRNEQRRILAETEPGEIEFCDDYEDWRNESKIYDRRTKEIEDEKELSR